MPRKCSVCANKNLNKINSSLVKKVSYRQVAQRFRLSEWSVYRHRRDHLPVTLSKSQEVIEVAEADSLVSELQQLHRRFLTILGKAEASGDLRTAIFAGREVRSDIELLARMRNEIEQGQTVNVTVSSEWTTVRADILQALECYPEAQRAIVTILNDKR